MILLVVNAVQMSFVALNLIAPSVIGATFGGEPVLCGRQIDEYRRDASAPMLCEAIGKHVKEWTCDQH